MLRPTWIPDVPTRPTDSGMPRLGRDRAALATNGRSHVGCAFRKDQDDSGLCSRPSSAFGHATGSSRENTHLDRWAGLRHDVPRSRPGLSKKSGLECSWPNGRDSRQNALARPSSRGRQRPSWASGPRPTCEGATHALHAVRGKSLVLERITLRLRPSHGSIPARSTSKRIIFIFFRQIQSLALRAGISVALREAAGGKWSQRDAAEKTENLLTYKINTTKASTPGPARGG